MTPHSTHLLSLDLVLIKLVNQVAGAGIGHMNSENQEEEEEAQQGDTGHSLGLTHPDTKYNQTFAKIISSNLTKKKYFCKILSFGQKN